MPVWTTGTSGGALQFNGTSNYITLNNTGTTGILKPASLPVSICGWVNLSGTNSSQTIFTSDEFDPVKYAGCSLQIKNDLIMVNYGDGITSGPTHRQSKTGSTLIVPGQWYHIAAVISGSGNMEIYVNGVDNGGSYSGSGGPMAYSTAPSMIGASAANSSGTATSYYLEGALEDIRVYDYALTPEQISVMASKRPQ